MCTGGVASGLHVQAIQGELAAVGGVGARGAAGVGAVGGGRVFGGVGVGLGETEREGLWGSIQVDHMTGVCGCVWVCVLPLDPGPGLDQR